MHGDGQHDGELGWLYKARSTSARPSFTTSSHPPFNPLRTQTYLQNIAHAAKHSSQG